jgi:hypothetical protein
MPESSIGKDITEAQVKGLFDLWSAALASGDADAVAMRYSKDAVMLPTISDEPHTDYNAIKRYFENFLQNKPQCKILESHVTIGNNWCKDVGTYMFSRGIDGSKLKARYSFIYVWEDNEWKISHHHSSLMPESVLEVLEDEEELPDPAEAMKVMRMKSTALPK